MPGKCRLFPPGVDDLLILPGNAVGVIPCFCSTSLGGGKQLGFFRRTDNTICIDE